MEQKAVSRCQTAFLEEASLGNIKDICPKGSGTHLGRAPDKRGY